MLHFKPKSGLSNCLPFYATKFFLKMQDICFNYQVPELTPNKKVPKQKHTKSFF